MQNNAIIPWKVLAAGVFLTFSIWAPLFAVPPMGTILSNSLSLSHTQTGLLFSGPVIMLALAAIPAGIVADRIGIKKAIGIGVIVTFIGALLRGTAASYSSLLIFSLIYGLGLGWTFANVPKLARSISPPQKTLLVMGILIGAGVLGGGALSLAITVPLIYPLTNNYQIVFYIWSIPVFIASILWWTAVPSAPSIALEIKSGTAPSTGLKELLNNKILWLLAFLLFMHNFVFYTWTGWIPSYLLTKGLSASYAGLTTSVMLWVGIPTVITVSLISSGASFPRKLFVWIPSLIYVFLAVGILYASQFSVWFIMALSGIVNVMRFNTLLTLPVEIFPGERAGAVSGVVVAAGYLGAVVGPVIAGQILDITDNFSIIFGTLSVISLITMGFAFLIPRTSH